MTSPPAEELSIGRGAAIATLGTALSRATGFVRLAALAFALGVSESKLADTYNLANSTPNILYELVLGGILSSVVLRIYVEVKREQGQDEAWRFISRLTCVSMLVLGAISVIAVLAAPFIFKIYTAASPRSELQQNAGVFLLRLFVPQLLFYGLSTISTAVLNAHKKFGVPMFAPVLNNLAVTITLLLFAWKVPASLRQLDRLPHDSLILLGLGTTAGVMLLGLIPWLYMRRAGFKFMPKAGLRDPRFRRVATLSAYMLGYVATNQVGLAVAMILANRVQGGVSAYQYAYVFFQLPHGLLAVSIATAIFPRLAESSVANDLGAVGRRLGQGLRQIAFFVLPAAAGYLAIAPELVRLLLEHGLTTTASTELIATVLRAWALGIFFFSSFYLLLRGFYAMGDTRTPMLINIASFAVNVVTNLALFFAFDDPNLKIAGLAIGHASSYAVASLIAAWIMGKRVGSKSLTSGYVLSVSKIVAASTLTGVIAWATVTAITANSSGASFLSQLFPVLAATVAGLVVYAASSKALRIEEFKWVTDIALRRG